jgi:Holliday junction resolvase RusA-like endonuclease
MSTPPRISFSVSGTAVPAVRMTRGGLHAPEHVKRDAIDRHLAWRSYVGHMARQHLAAIGWDFDALGPPFRTERLAVEITLCVRALRGDVDNLAKCITDGLEGVLYLNDSRIDRLTIERRRTRQEELAVITVSRLEDR